MKTHKLVSVQARITEDEKKDFIEAVSVRERDANPSGVQRDFVRGYIEEYLRVKRIATRFVSEVESTADESEIETHVRLLTRLFFEDSYRVRMRRYDTAVVRKRLEELWKQIK